MHLSPRKLTSSQAFLRVKLPAPGNFVFQAPDQGLALDFTENQQHTASLIHLSLVTFRFVFGRVDETLCHSRLSTRYALFLF